MAIEGAMASLSPCAFLGNAFEIVHDSFHRALHIILSLRSLDISGKHASSLLHLSSSPLPHLIRNQISDHPLRQEVQGPSLHGVLPVAEHKRLRTSNFVQTSSCTFICSDRPGHLVRVARRSHIADDKSQNVHVVDVLGCQLVLE